MSRSIPRRDHSRHGVDLSRKTGFGWMAQSAWLREPVWKAMRAEALESRVIQADDTTVLVPDRRPDRRGRRRANA